MLPVLPIPIPPHGAPGPLVQSNVNQGGWQGVLPSRERTSDPERAPGLGGRWPPHLGSHDWPSAGPRSPAAPETRPLPATPCGGPCRKRKRHGPGLEKIAPCVAHICGCPNGGLEDSQGWNPEEQPQAMPPCPAWKTRSPMGATGCHPVWPRPTVSSPQMTLLSGGVGLGSLHRTKEWQGHGRLPGSG